MALKRSDIPRPILPMEAISVAELGGEVIVRGLRLSERLELGTRHDIEEGYARQMLRILAACVIDADHEPIFTVDEWEAFGAKHPKPTVELWDVASRLSGLNAEDAEKK